MKALVILIVVIIVVICISGSIRMGGVGSGYTTPQGCAK